MNIKSRTRLIRKYSYHLGLLISLFLPAMPIFALDKIDNLPRVAVISAYEPEWKLLKNQIQNPRQYIENGTVFITGELENKPIVLFLSGMSMVNAAMTTQLALDKFNIDRIVFSGVAGGVDPSLSVGDVVVPSQWSEYLEMVYAREKGQSYSLPEYAAHYKSMEHYGMMYPQPIFLTRKGHTEIEQRYWFPADKSLLNLAKQLSVSSIKLKQCTSDGHCLHHQPTLLIGGNGVSGQAFNDNKQFRDYTYHTFKAEALDMESAAIAHVAYSNAIPFIIFRGLSDLAGGGPGENEEEVFEQLAADNSAIVIKEFLKIMPTHV